MDMGMTDKQFNGFLRLLIKNLNEVQTETELDKKDELLKEIIADLQKTIED